MHSLHSLLSLRSSRSHTGPRPLSDITYIDEDTVKTPSPHNNSLNLQKHNHTTLSPPVDSYRLAVITPGSFLPDIPKVPHETSI